MPAVRLSRVRTTVCLRALRTLTFGISRLEIGPPGRAPKPLRLRISLLRRRSEPPMHDNDRKGPVMPRITVTTDTLTAEGELAVLLDEEVRSIHLESGHAAAQLIERLAWAIIDAEETETPRRELPVAPTGISAHRSRTRDARRPATALRRVAFFSGAQRG
jgi:hypothetical protein